MNRLISPVPRRLPGLLLLAVLVPVMIFLTGCTDLDEQTYGVVTPEEFFQTETEFLAAVAPVYAQLRALSTGDWQNVIQHSSDETLVPTRGGDWDDGGIWRELHRHTWSATHGPTNGAWVSAFTGVARANSVLANLEGAPEELEDVDLFTAEARTLRAFYYWALMDLFGNVPIVTEEQVDPENPPANSSRAEVFDFIVEEINEALSDLPEQQPDQGRVTQGAAQALLATLYLNAEIYRGEVTANGIERGEPMWEETVDVVQEIIDSGQYQLAPSFFDNFVVNNHESPEIIFAAGHLARSGLGFNRQMATLHYNQLDVATPWNGFATLAEFYNTFEEEDERRDIFLVGQQYAQPRSGCIGSGCYSDEESGPLEDRGGNPLTFTEEIPSLTNASETHGIRVLKWELDPNQVGAEGGNDFAFFRYAEMLLTQAEALNELGQTAEAIELVNEVRERVFDPPQPLDTGMSQADAREAILNERGYELTWEAKRRTDLIRHDLFLEEWEHKQQSSPHRVLFPIPQAQLDANPNLVQNPGY